MSTPQIDRLRELLEPPVLKAGAELQEITLTPAGKRRVLRVVVDAENDLDLDRIAEITRAVSTLLDAGEVMGETPYQLEVSSPGAERPLNELRDWRRAAGRLAHVVLAEGGELTARIGESDEEGVDVVVQPVKGRGRPKPRRLSFSEIAGARIQVEFNRKDDADNADEQNEQNDNESKEEE
jgi:ribosome maturation factor RimP